MAVSLLEVYDSVTELVRSGRALSIWTPGFGGIAEGILKMSMGNRIGFEYETSLPNQLLFDFNYGSFIIELKEEEEIGTLLGYTTEEESIIKGESEIALTSLLEVYENKLEGVYPCNIKQEKRNIPTLTAERGSYPNPAVKTSKPKVLIPVFPGTNCEYDTAKQAEAAGCEAEIFVVQNLNAEAIARSVDKFAAAAKNSQMIFLPGGFSGGDEPEGSGKFIAAFFRNAAVKEETERLLNEREGLMCGICNGFQALIKLGLVPYGRIVDMQEDNPTLTYNTISRHQSMIVRTRIVSNASPWLAETKPGDIFNVPISHGEGRFIANEEMLKKLIKNNQIATQYVDLEGKASSDIAFNPNDSIYAIEGITSPDGRVLGKMGHSERIGAGLYQNVPGSYDIGLFRSAVRYFKGEL